MEGAVWEEGSSGSSRKHYRELDLMTGHQAPNQPVGKLKTMYSVSWNMLDTHMFKHIPLRLQESISLIDKSNHVGAVLYIHNTSYSGSWGRRIKRSWSPPGSSSEPSYQILKRKRRKWIVVTTKIEKKKTRLMDPMLWNKLQNIGLKLFCESATHFCSSMS